MCSHELWPTSVNHPFFYLNSLLGIAGGKLPENCYPYLKTWFFKILPFQVAFLILFSVVIFSHYFLLVGLLVQYVALIQSGN